MSRKKLELTHPDYPGAFGKFDRHSTLAWQYGRGGGAHYLPGEPGDPEFHERYQHLAGIRVERENYVAELSKTYTKAAASGSIPYPPRGLSRYEAARYVGVAPTIFDEMVRDGKMPTSKRVGRLEIWDRFQLDIAFNALETGDPKDRLEQLLRESPRVKTL